MSVYQKLQKTMDNRDLEAYLELLHEDAVFIFHKSGSSFSKSEWSEMVKGMLANDNFIQESSRCVYENEDIMVFHDFMSYPDNSREAVMGVATLKDGKIIRMETGATTLA